jgi:hypothetical protein
MKSIDNYINERLNPRHLGPTYVPGSPCDVIGSPCWEFEAGGRKQRLQTSDWKYVILSGTGKTFSASFLFFWSPSTNFVFEIVSFRDSVVIMEMKPNVTNKSNFVQILREMFEGPTNLIRYSWASNIVSYSGQVRDIINDFRQKYK